MSIPKDDLARSLTLVDAADPALPHVGVFGDTYTILIRGEQTGGRYCLVDMLVPPGGGPPPHRHDFEEMFHLLEGELVFTFRGQRHVARAGQTLNVPANAPHGFRNESAAPARMLCWCAPAGNEQLFLQIGVPVASRTATPPKPSEAELTAIRRKAEALAPTFKTELLPPG